MLLIVPNVKECDARGDAMKNCCPVQNFKAKKLRLYENKKAVNCFTAFCL